MFSPQRDAALLASLLGPGMPTYARTLPLGQVCAVIWRAVSQVLVIETIVEGYENPENSFSLHLPIWIKSLFLKNCAAYNASSPHVLD